MSIFKTYINVTLVNIFLISISLSNSGGVPGNYANNAPSMNNCTSCHYGSANSGDGNVTISGLPATGYVPGESYSLTVQVIGTNRNGYGFQMASQVGNDNAGTFSLGANSENAELNGNKVQQSSRTISGEWVVETDTLAPFGTAVLIGGFVGSRLGSDLIPQRTVRIFLVVVLMLAAARRVLLIV